MSALLLDTCVAIWLAEGLPIAPSALSVLEQAAAAESLLISPVSAWEIGLLSVKQRLVFRPDPTAWFQRLMAGPGIRPAPFTPEIAIAAAYLPGVLHGDPADRLLAATARDLKATLVTRDARLLDYARSGHLRALAA